MKRTFLLADHDCGEEVPVVVEEVRVDWNECGELGCLLCCPYYRLVSWPSTCKCGRPMPLMEASQEDLRAAYALPESEGV